MRRTLRSRARIVAGLPALWREAGRPLAPRPPGPDRLDLALPPPADGALTRLEREVHAGTGYLRSGFLVLRANAEALRWRMALADAAVRSLDLQYYVWWADRSGTALLARARAAADRGVRVRLLLDDLTTVLADASTPVVRDAAFAALAAHPNIAVRLFNCWHSRSRLGRLLELLARTDQLNHRMHNKVLVADNRAAVLGGRNIGDEYFGRSEDFNFLDLDVLGIGPVARQASAVFDMYWNSDLVVPPEALGIVPGPAGAATPAAPAGPAPAPLAGLPALLPGASVVYGDAPDPDGSAQHVSRAVREMIGRAQREVLIVNAYVIPDAAFVGSLRALVARGVRVRLLTNSLASHDVPAVNSHYKPWRKPLLEAGVELFELRADAALKAELVDAPPDSAAFIGLHSKAVVIDRNRVFVGSMNLDPRSRRLNTEMGTVIYGERIAAAVAADIELATRPENAWAVTLDGSGRLRWTSSAGVRRLQPARSLWQRVQDVVFMAFSKELY
ncbi:MAG: phospholipase D family protein [Geminicoccaceae bacterium]